MTTELELDEWCAKRAAEASTEHQIAKEKWRRDQLLGEHRAYQAMRSFIHGARSIQGKE